MYKIFTDKKEDFTCQLEVEGSDVENTRSRLILETDKGYSVLFPGKVDKTGKCVVTIDKVKNILKESDSGRIKLEVIADDTLFVPWESTFTVKASKKVTLAENSNLISSKSQKTSVKATVSEQKYKAEENKLTRHVKTIVKIVEAYATTKKKFNLNQIFEVYEKQASLSAQDVIDLKKVFNP